MVIPPHYPVNPHPYWELYNEKNPCDSSKDSWLGTLPFEDRHWWEPYLRFNIQYHIYTFNFAIVMSSSILAQRTLDLLNKIVSFGFLPP